MLIVCDVIFAINCKGGEFKLIDQHRSNIILRGQRIGCGQDYIRSALCKTGIRLAVSAVTCKQADMRMPFNGFSFLKRWLILRKQAFPFRPIHAAAPAFGLIDVLDIVIIAHGFSFFILSKSDIESFLSSNCFLNAFDEFLLCVAMTLRTAAFQTINGRQRTDFTTQYPIPVMGITGQKTAAEGITDAGWVNDLTLRTVGIKYSSPSV